MKILIVGPGYRSPFEGLGEITENVNKFVKSPEDFGLVVFTGGEDVHPALYGHTSPLNLCHFNSVRDAKEQIIFELAKEFEIPMTGICRGSQFLNAMSGGTLMHHISNHGTNHTAVTNTGEVFEVTSTHHQMCLPAKDGVILAWSEFKRSHVYYWNEDKKIDYAGQEVEAYCYPHKRIFAVQYHPEYMDTSSRGFKWYREGVFNLMHLSPEEFEAAYQLKSRLTK